MKTWEEMSNKERAEQTIRDIKRRQALREKQIEKGKKDAVDYIFDQASYPFGLGKNSVATGILFRDILIKTLEDINNSGQTWLR